MRLVLDTNVFIAAVVADGLCRDLVRVRVLPHAIITSEPLMRELRNTLRKKFAADPDELPLLRQLSDEAEIVAPARLRERVCRDKDDDIVLATAVAGRADVIVTGDNDLLGLKRFRDVRILSPRQFLVFLDRRCSISGSPFLDLFLALFQAGNDFATRLKSSSRISMSRKVVR